MHHTAKPGSNTATRKQRSNYFSLQQRPALIIQTGNQSTCINLWLLLFHYRTLLSLLLSLQSTCILIFVNYKAGFVYDDCRSNHLISSQNSVYSFITQLNRKLRVTGEMVE